MAITNAQRPGARGEKERLQALDQIEALSGLCIDEVREIQTIVRDDPSDLELIIETVAPLGS